MSTTNRYICKKNFENIKSMQKNPLDKKYPHIPPILPERKRFTNHNKCRKDFAKYFKYKI